MVGDGRDRGERVGMETRKGESPETDVTDGERVDGGLGTKSNIYLYYLPPSICYRVG